MAILRKNRLRSDAPGKRHRRDGEVSKTAAFFEGSQLIQVLIFFAFAALVIFISFIGFNEPVPAVVSGQRAQSRVVADFSFEFQSQIATRERREEASDRVLPVYRLSLEPFENFAQFIPGLEEDLQILRLQLETMPADDRDSAIEAFAQSILRETDYELDPRGLRFLLDYTDAAERSLLLAKGLEILEDIYRRGIYETDEPFLGSARHRMNLITLVDRRDQDAQVRVQPLPEATFELNQRLRTVADPEVSRALFTILRAGLQPNLIHDREMTAERKRKAREAVPPVMVQVREGDTILEPGAITTEFDQEKLLAYRAALLRQSRLNPVADTLLLKRILFALGILFAAVIYVRVLAFSTGRQNRRLSLAMLAVLLNIGLIRLVLKIGELELFVQSPEVLALLPYVAPTAIGAMIASLLVGPPFAVLTSLVVAFLFSLMMGGAFDTLFITFLSSLVTIHFCRDVRRRGTVVKAGLLAGLTVALCATFLGLLNEVAPAILARQVLFALLSGVVTGIIVVGLLPVLENLFQLTTEITLLELTDYNHPLLRRMQIEAPGSYHHSLMVANMAENAAAAIKANPLVCRTCSLFHDIGKLVKPEYFTENQKGGINPHLAQNPSMSALVIKAHVKEGVQLARQHKLPRIVIEVIRQHHGTSLIQYFYYSALKKSRGHTGNTGAPFPEAPTIKAEEVDESTYRYDGPKPTFKESAIIHFADSVEAASRSLKKVSPTAIDELLDRIFQDRLEDGQLDNCPITFEEVSLIKRSFSFTLLNMLHSRVEYPRKEGPDKTRTSAAPAKRDEEPQETGSGARSSANA